MSYENRPVPEGINVSHEHPLKEFFSLLAALALIVVVTVAGLALIAQYLAPLVPFSLEQKLLASTGFDDAFDEDLSDDQKHIESYLQTLGDKLAANMELPDDMQIHVHYSTEDTVNAYATLAGHIVIYQGLLNKLPHENALAMVMAHEIAHIKLRHPIVASGRGLTVTLALTTIGGFADSSVVAGLINNLGLASTLGFNRWQENAADSEALDALLKYYGHVAGADVLFRLLAEESAIELPAFFSTHPNSEQRIERIREFAQRHGLGGELTELPDSFNISPMT